MTPYGPMGCTPKTNKAKNTKTVLCRLLNPLAAVFQWYVQLALLEREGCCSFGDISRRILFSTSLISALTFIISLLLITLGAYYYLVSYVEG